MSTEAELLANLPAGVVTVLRDRSSMRAFDRNGKLTYWSSDDPWTRVTTEGFGTAEQHRGVGWTEITPAPDDPSGDLPDGTVLRTNHPSDTIKMLRETFCVAQARIGNPPLDEGRKDEHIARLGRLIAYCDWVRPPRPDPLGGHPGSLWRDPETNTLWVRLVGDQDTFKFAQVGGELTRRGLLADLLEDDVEIIARLVPVEEGEQ